MIIDCRAWQTLPDRGEALRRRVFVDGKEIIGVWYVDTDRSMVKTYQIFQDADARTLRRYTPSLTIQDEDTLRRQMRAARGFDRHGVPPDWEIEADDLERAVSRIIRGKVELKPLNNDETG